MNIVKLATAAVISGVVGLSFLSGAQADDWGCKVLLCASSSNPSWHGVPACHAPMHRLIDAMDGWNFKWPTCPEAGTGGPGYERYAACPAGWSIGYSENRRGVQLEPDRCIRVKDMCARQHRVRRDQCRRTVSIDRPRRVNPYYFDIPDENGHHTRIWFALKR